MNRPMTLGQMPAQCVNVPADDPTGCYLRRDVAEKKTKDARNMGAAIGVVTGLAAGWILAKLL